MQLSVLALLLVIAVEDISVDRPTSCITTAVDASTSMHRRSTLSILSPSTPTGTKSTVGSAMVLECGGVHHAVYDQC